MVIACINEKSLFEVLCNILHITSNRLFPFMHAITILCNKERKVHFKRLSTKILNVIDPTSINFEELQHSTCIFFIFKLRNIVVNQTDIPILIHVCQHQYMYICVTVYCTCTCNWVHVCV